MIRDDISDRLIHLTKPSLNESAANVFLKIITDGCLLGGTGYIKGNHKCVCFTESPLGKLVHVLAEPTIHKEMKYEPFGVMVSKQWLYEQGGRPVIYQSDDEYDLLNEKQKYRHVRYEPSGDYVVDHSWEREWRIQTEKLTLDQKMVTLVVPTREWMQWFLDHSSNRVPSSSHPTSDIASTYSWHFVVLNDLGVNVKCATPHID